MIQGRKSVKLSVTLLGIVAFLLVIFVAGRQLDSMAKDKHEKTSIQQYSGFYISEDPLGPPITVIERASLKPGYWLNYNTSRSNGCVVQAYLSLRWNTRYRGQALNAIWPLSDSSTKFEVVPTNPARRAVAYYVRFDQVFPSNPPLGHYSLQRLTEFKCGSGDPVQVAHNVDFEMR